MVRTELWNGHAIRFVEKEPGEWWGVAFDIAKALGYSNTRSAISRHCKHQTTVPKRDGGSLTIIPINDIYRLIMRSHLPEAEQFEEWVFNVIDELRKASGLEGFQIFRMLDKEHQKEMMAKLRNGLKNPSKVDYIKANTIANKAVSSMFGYPKMVKKDSMSPDMLLHRQTILDDTVNLMSVADEFNIDCSVSEKIYGKYCSEVH